MEVLIGQLFEGIKPAVLAWYQDQTGIAQKMHQLDMLVTKIRSVQEASEKLEITSENLRKWQGIFKDAATKGDEVLQQLQSTQDHQANSSSSTSGIGSFFHRLISKKDDMEKLNNTIEWLEQISAEVDFLKTLKLEASNRQKVVRYVFSPRKMKNKYPRERLLRAGSLVRTSSMDYGHTIGFSAMQAKVIPPEMENKSRMTKRKKKNEGPETTLFSLEKIEEIGAVEGLAAKIQDAVDRAKQQEVSGSSSFKHWIAKLEDAVNEANSVASALKSCNYDVNDEILDEVGAIVTAVRLRLESISIHDLEDFSNLLQIEIWARAREAETSQQFTTD